MNKKQIQEIAEAQAKIIKIYEGDPDTWDDAGSIIEEIEAKYDTLTIGVADGHATYIQLEDNNMWATFRWFEGGPDGYICSIGEVFAIPSETARQRVNSNRKLREIFAEQRKKNAGGE